MPNERWSLDFVHDTLQNACRIRAVNIVDDFTREALAIEVDTSNSGWRVAPPAATSNCTRRGHFKMYQPERSEVFLRICLRRSRRLPVSGREAVLVKAVALAADLDQMGVVHEPIKECGNGRSVAEELGPVVERAV